MHETDNRQEAVVVPLRDHRAETAGPSQGGVAQFMATERFPDAIRLLAQSFVDSHMAAPRASALFATQQRWLLCLAALGQHFRALRLGGAGVSRREVGHLALQHGIASRNTAYAFFEEILQYGVVLPVGEGRADEVMPSPETLTILAHWFAIHLAALDHIDGGARGSRFREDSQRLLPLVAAPLIEGLLPNPAVRMPGPLYRIFAWTDAGGLLMDRLIAGIDRTVREPRGHLTDVSAISELSRAFGLSRAHTSRKLAEAESIGGIGWSGRRGYSRLWVSRAFYTEYATAQARKLIVFREAFAAGLALASKMDSDDCAVFS